jgi:hypothetical protein
MKRLLFTVFVLFFCLSIIAKDNGVTFVVDKDLPAASPVSKMEENSLVENILNVNGASGMDYIKSSIKNERLRYLGQDAFYQSVVKAFAEHKSLVLSPDMIWLIISQEFSYYVNNNAEKLRDKIVSHSGKKELLVLYNSKKSLFDATDQEWSVVINDFVGQIGQNTKSDLEKNMVANFTTTGQTELIASQIVLMHTVQQYFEYTVARLGCGIPSITLQGTTADWQKVYDKTMKLGDYELEWWTNQLKPILKEFINASKGRPNTAFWQDIVCINSSQDQRLGRAGCGMSDKEIDGWILKFFPFDHEDGIRKSVGVDTKMLPEMVSVPFTYKIVYTHSIEQYHMELWAGFVGAKEEVVLNKKDLSTNIVITPQIGWIVRKGDDKSNTPFNPQIGKQNTLSPDSPSLHEQGATVIKDSLIGRIPGLDIILRSGTNRRTIVR